MNVIPEIVPMAELQSGLGEVLAQIRQGPIVLTQNDHAAAVLVLPEQWNTLVEELEDLRDALDAAQAYAAYQQAPEAVRPWREIRAELVAAGQLNG